jgi:M6 family metalloprotease-like protein
MITSKHSLRIILCGLWLFCLLPLYSAYLSNMPMHLTQPDGTKLNCLASGDEYHHWLHDADGYTILQSSQTGYYTYAERSGDGIRAGNVIVGKSQPRAAGLLPFVNISQSAYQRLRSSRFQAPALRNAPTIGTVNNLVVYIRFSDQTEFGQNNSVYDGWFNTGTSSQKNYFLEASYNQLTVNTTFYPAPVSGLVVSWQDSHPRAYYSPYDASTNPIGYSNATQQTDRLFTLLANATAGVASAVPAGLNIDADGDGNVDNVVFIAKGGSDAWADLLWPHRWSIYDRTVTLNGKRVYDYNFQLQDFLTSSNVGVICHEFFHTLGSPDLYHYNESVFTPVGSWDLMEWNTNPPQHMGAFMKWKYGGWISSIPTITLDQVYTLNPLTSSTGNVYRIDSPNSASEYFVVEFRKKTGTFENQIPGSGLLVYRINTLAGDGNASGPPDEVYIYRPGGTTLADGTISTAFFSSEAGRTAINNATNPSAFLSSGAAGGLSLYNIGSSAGSTISFTKGSAPVVTIDFSTNPVIQGFDSATFPPDGWLNSAVTGAYSFEMVTSGTYPTTSPQAGGKMLRYNSYNASAGNSAILVTPRIDMNNIISYGYSLSFWMYRDNGYSSYADKILVYQNSTANLSGSPTLLATINRSTTLSPTVASNGWYNYVYDVNPATTGYYYLIFKAESAYGNNMYLDSVTLTRSTLGTIPNAAISPSPANLATGIAITSNLSWGSGGGVPTGYKFYLGTDNPPTNIVSGTNLGNVLTYNPAADFAYSTLYYWQVVPTNGLGDATGCPIWSFTTMSDPSISEFPHYEGFDGMGITSGWTQHFVAGNVSWVTNVGGNSSNPASAHSGAKNALFYSGDYTGNTTILVSPPLNLAGKNATLKFWHTQTKWGGDQDVLTVKYRTSAGGSWLDLAPAYSSDIASWTEESIDLPNESDGYYIGFSGSANWGYGICIDDVRIVLPSSDAAIGITTGGSATVDLPVITAAAGSFDTAVNISGLSGTPTITTAVEYQSPDITLPNSGLAFTFSGAAFGGTTITITHNLGFVPLQLAYRIAPAATYTLVSNPGSWTSTTATIIIPSAKADGDLIVVLPEGSGDTLPVEMSSFTAILTDELLVKLNWVVQSETDNLGYNVLRSYDNVLDHSLAVNSSLISTGIANGTEITYSFTDVETENNIRYYYWLENIAINGAAEYYGPVLITVGQPGEEPPVPQIPLTTALLDAYPNPFNPITHLQYTVKAAETVSIDIFNVRGQLIRSYSARHAKAGQYRIIWDGKDQHGRDASSGVYMYRMTSGKYAASKKMILMK